MSLIPAPDRHAFRRLSPAVVSVLGQRLNERVMSRNGTLAAIAIDRALRVISPPTRKALSLTERALRAGGNERRGARMFSPAPSGDGAKLALPPRPCGVDGPKHGSAGPEALAPSKAAGRFRLDPKRRLLLAQLCRASTLRKLESTTGSRERVSKRVGCDRRNLTRPLLKVEVESYSRSSFSSCEAT